SWSMATGRSNAIPTGQPTPTRRRLRSPPTPEKVSTSSAAAATAGGAWRSTAGAQIGPRGDSSAPEHSDPRHRSLPFNSRRRLGGDVVDDARDPGHLVDDAPRDVVEELVRQVRPVRGHEIHRLDRTQRDDVVVPAPIAHHPDRAHRQEHRERLTHALVEIVTAQLFDEDCVGPSQQVGIFLAHLAEDAYREAWAGKGMAIDHVARQAELDPEPPHFVLEELAQWLDELEMHALRQSPDVVMRLDDVRLAGARAGGFDDVGVDGALRQEAHVLQAVRLLVEYLDEDAANDLALGLRVGHPRESREEARPGIDADHVHAKMLCEGAHHLLRLAEPQQPVIDEHAGELIADGAVQER